jgi:nitroreductase
MLEGLIDAAVYAPGTVNEQQWNFSVIQNVPQLDRIFAAATLSMCRCRSIFDQGCRKLTIIPNCVKIKTG